MREKMKSVVVLTITAFICSLLLYLVLLIVGGNV